MPNTRISDLSAGGVFIGTDIFPVVETATVGPVKKTITQLEEFIEDVAGAAMLDSATIDFTYDDAAGTITAIVKLSSIDETHIDNTSTPTFESVTIDGASNALNNIDKNATANSALSVFKVNGSTRAEAGLRGNDDFSIRVSADGSSFSEAIFIDKDNGNVGFGTTAPAYATDIIGDIRVASNETDATLKTGRLFTRHYTNSEEDVLLFSSVTGNGFSSIQYGGGSGLHNAVTAIQFFTASSTTTLSGAEAMRITGSGNVGVGETSPGSKLHVDGGGIQCGNPTGGDKGTGAINAQAVYDDNTLLTCYVFDQKIDGAIVDAKWDGKTPDRIIPAKRELDENTGKEIIVAPEQIITRVHAPMRKFRARIGTVEDPLTLDGYAKHWKERRHLTSMPNEVVFDPVNGQLTTGEWIQRLVETAEIHAVLFEEVRKEYKAEVRSLQTAVASLVARINVLEGK